MPFHTFFASLRCLAAAFVLGAAALAGQAQTVAKPAAPAATAQTAKAVFAAKQIRKIRNDLVFILPIKLKVKTK